MCLRLDNSRTSYPFAFFAFLLARSLANRSAVRFFAAASDAFLARADRSSGVIFLAEALPPILPNFRAISAIAARTSAEIFMLMPSMVSPNRVRYVYQKRCRFLLTP